MEVEYFTKQILTYMGNKRTFLNQIDSIISFIKSELGENNIDIAEGFTGSGIVTRLFKNRIMGDDSQEYMTTAGGGTVVTPVLVGAGSPFRAPYI